MDVKQIRELSIGNIGAVKQMYWNPQGTWPDDFTDIKQNPHGGPIDYWCPTVGGQQVGWEGVSGWPTKERALEIAQKFQNKCVEWLDDNDA